MKGFINFKIAAVWTLILFGSMVFLAGCQNGSQIKTSGESFGRQTMCPVMPNTRIDPTINLMYKGKKVYFCCKGCVSRFRANPEKYSKNLPQFNSE